MVALVQEQEWEWPDIDYGPLQEIVITSKLPEKKERKLKRLAHLNEERLDSDPNAFIRIGPCEYAALWPENKDLDAIARRMMQAIDYNFSYRVEEI